MPKLFCRIGKSPWLGRLPGSCREGSFWAGDPCGSWDEVDAQEEDIHERIFSGKQIKTENERLTEDLARAGWKGSPAYLLSARTPACAPGGSKGPTHGVSVLPTCRQARGVAVAFTVLCPTLHHMCEPCVAPAPRIQPFQRLL